MVAAYTDTGDGYRLDDRQDVFKKDWITRFTVVDPACSTKKKSKYTAICTFGITPAPHKLLVLNVVREHLRIEQILPQLDQVCERWQPHWVGIEGVLFQKALAVFGNNKALFPHIPTIKDYQPGTRSKLERATPAIIRAERGHIYLPHAAPWLEDWEAEHVLFTGDEKVDAFTDLLDCTAYAVMDMDQLAGPDYDDEPFACGSYPDPWATRVPVSTGACRSRQTTIRCGGGSGGNGTYSGSQPVQSGRRSDLSAGSPRRQWTVVDLW